MAHNRAIALANNDVALVAWSYDHQIDDCLGFAIHRRSSSQPAPTPLSAWVGFEDDADPDWQPRTTVAWPIQKFNWRDLTAAAGATYTYEIVPMVGEPGALQPREDLRLTAGPVSLTAKCSEHVHAYFTRGILSTRHLVCSLPQGPGGGPGAAALLDHIATVGDPLRTSLAGQSLEALSSLIVRAIREGGRCHAALHELDDPELVALLDTPARISLVLSNAATQQGHDHINAAARERLHRDHVDVTDRILAGGHIGHDKFAVYVDAAGEPQTVLTGSTDWTTTGLCTQSNNAIVIDDGALAATYLDFWHRLQAECPPDEPARQSAALRTDNDRARDFTVDGAETTLWLSPNTARLTKSPDAPRPDDMVAVFDAIHAARHGILFLLCQPGRPSVLDAIVEAQRARPDSTSAAPPPIRAPSASTRRGCTSAPATPSPPWLRRARSTTSSPSGSKSC